MNFKNLTSEELIVAMLMILTKLPRKTHLISPLKPVRLMDC